MIQVLNTVPLTQLPASAPEKAEGNGPTTQALVTHVGYLDGIVSPNLVQACLCSHLGSEPVDERSLSLLLSFNFLNNYLT